MSLVIWPRSGSLDPETILPTGWRDRIPLSIGGLAAAFIPKVPPKSDEMGSRIKRATLTHNTLA